MLEAMCYNFLDHYFLLYLTWEKKKKKKWGAISLREPGKSRPKKELCLQRSVTQPWAL